MNGDADIKAATEEVRKLLATAIDKIVAGAEKAGESPSGAQPQARLFFPNGIELILIKFKVGDKVDISFAVAGKDAPLKVGSTLVATGGADGESVSAL